MLNITDDKILDQFVYELDPIIGCEVLKENLQTLEEACVLAEQISQIASFVGGGGTHSKWCEPPDYAPMELDSIGTY